jgi:hypothetical protein
MQACLYVQAVDSSLLTGKTMDFLKISRRMMPKFSAATGPFLTLYMEIVLFKLLREDGMAMRDGSDQRWSVPLQFADATVC